MQGLVRGPNALDSAPRTRSTRDSFRNVMKYFITQVGGHCKQIDHFFRERLDGCSAGADARQTGRGVCFYEVRVEQGGLPAC